MSNATSVDVQIGQVPWPGQLRTLHAMGSTTFIAASSVPTALFRPYRTGRGLSHTTPTIVFVVHTLGLLSAFGPIRTTIGYAISTIVLSLAAVAAALRTALSTQLEAIR